MLLKSLQFYQSIRTILSLLIFGCWLSIILRSFIPIIVIDEIIVHYEYEQQRQNDDNKNDDDELKLQEMKVCNERKKNKKFQFVFSSF